MALEESALAASLSSKRKKALCHLDKAVVNDVSSVFERRHRTVNEQHHRSGATIQCTTGNRKSETTPTVCELVCDNACPVCS